MAALLLLAGLASAYLRLPAGHVDRGIPEPAQAQWPEGTPLSSADWSLFMRSPTKAPQQTGTLSGKYRLAGTFFTYAGAPESEGDCKAIIDNLGSGRQFLLSENGRLDNMLVKRILRDHVILLVEGREEVLWLSFSGEEQAHATGAGAKKAGPAPSPGGDPSVLEENRFGKRVGDTRWVLQRNALIDYYEELLDDPERLANVYISLAPVYNDQRKIEGYTLDMTGEKDFFNAVGLRQDDVIRKVNSMKMTSQARAEYFLSEFAKNRVSALVLDIERDNEPTKLIYLIR